MNLEEKKNGLRDQCKLVLWWAAHNCPGSCTENEIIYQTEILLYFTNVIATMATTKYNKQYNVRSTIY